jgi:hypothetical protein
MNKVDKIFKNKLSHAHTDVPAHNWEKIAARLDDVQTSNHFTGYKWTLAIGAVFIAVMTSFLSLAVVESATKGSSNIQQDHAQVSQSIALTNTPNQGSTSSNLQKIISTKSSAEALVAKVSSSDISNSNADNVKFQEQKISNSKSEFTPTKINIETAPNLSSTLIDVSRAADEQLHANCDISAATTERVIELVDNTNLHLERSLKSELDPIKRLESTSISHRDPVTFAPLTFNTARKFRSKPTKVAQSCPFTLETNNKSIELFLSHDYMMSSLSGNDDIQNVINNRLSTESQLYSYTAGFRFGYRIAPRWNIHLGANYSRQNQKFTYIDPESNQERTITTKVYVYDSGTIVDSIVTTEVVIIPGTNKVIKANKFTSFDIPIIGRFTLLGTRNFSLSTMAGPVFNVSYSHRGMVVGEDLKPQDISDNKIFKPQLGVKLYTGISLAYHISGDLDFVFEPHARIGFDDVTKSNYPVSQRNQTFGLHTGLRYKF